VATPAAIALIDPSLAPIVSVATSQIAAAVVTDDYPYPYIDAICCQKGA
jgi:2-keto-3-deoxygluconate permease